MSETAGRYKLERPVTLPADTGGHAETLTEIVLRRASAGDLRVMDGKAGIAQAIALIARLSGHKPAVIDLLDSDDFQALCDMLDASGDRTVAKG